MDKNVRIFLASSSELADDRKEIEIFIGRKNKQYVKEGIFLELNIWEDFIDAMSATRLQDEYNKAVEGCDIFVSLFFTKAGKYTEEEFLKAYETFKEKGKPLIYTYFKDAPVNMSKITPEILSLLNFKQKLADLGHFITAYTDINDLKLKLSEQLVKILPSVTGVPGKTLEKFRDTRETVITNTLNVTGNGNISIQGANDSNITINR